MAESSPWNTKYFRSGVLVGESGNATVEWEGNGGKRWGEEYVSN